MRVCLCLTGGLLLAGWTCVLLNLKFGECLFIGGQLGATEKHFGASVVIDQAEKVPAATFTISINTTQCLCVRVRVGTLEPLAGRQVLASVCCLQCLLSS